MNLKFFCVQSARGGKRCSRNNTFHATRTCLDFHGITVCNCALKRPTNSELAQLIHACHVLLLLLLQTVFAV
jgi:hypothetical protein